MRQDAGQTICCAALVDQRFMGRRVMDDAKGQQPQDARRRWGREISFDDDLVVGLLGLLVVHWIDDHRSKTKDPSSDSRDDP